MRQTLLRFLRRHGEKLALLIYLGLTIAITPILARLFAAGWENGHVLPALFELRVLVGLEQSILNLAFLGLVVGLLAVLTLDRKKRVPAVLLWIGLGSLLAGFSTMGTFLPAIEGTETLIWLAPGLAVGLLFGGALKLLTLQSTGMLEFRSAARLVYFLFFILVLISFLEAHLVYPEFIEVSTEGITVYAPEPSGVSIQTSGLAEHAVAGILAVATVRRFVRYDSDDDFFVLGPPASGKSLLLIGAYLEALDRGRGKRMAKRDALNPSQDLMELVEHLDRDDTEWIVEATGRSELKELEFQFVKGTLFPKNVTVSSVDYAGEHLSRIPDALNGEIKNPDKELEQLTAGVKQANTLILLIDIERFVNNDGLGIAEYFSILEAAEDKDVIVVATKADLFADQFWEEEEKKAHESFEEFRDFVAEKLRQSEQFSSLLRQTPEVNVHPVYYETTVNEDGERVPVRDENGSVVTVGFDHLLDRLGR